jgi:hypothetical protein
MRCSFSPGPVPAFKLPACKLAASRHPDSKRWKVLLLGWAGFDRMGSCCSSRSGSSSSDRVIVIISILHSQFLLMIHNVMECCLVACCLCSRVQVHFGGDSSLPSICFCGIMSASSAMAGASARQVVCLPTMYLYTCTACGAEFMRAEKVRQTTLETFSMEDRIKVFRYSLLRASSKSSTTFVRVIV